MRTHVALLRGINVGGRNKVAMADLRELAEAIGHRDVATYVQSGNVVFAASRPRTDSGALADAFERELADRLGVDAAVVVLSSAELDRVVADNPFPHVEDERTLHAVFLRRAPGPGGVDAVGAAVERARAKGSPDDARVAGRALYLWTPAGFARSVLRAELERGGALRSPMPEGTARNWATVGALVAMLGA